MRMLLAISLGLDAAGTLVVMAVVIQAIVQHAASAGRVDRIPDQQRLLAAGLVFALTFKSGAGVLRTASVQTWEQVGMVAAIIALRFFLGKVLGSAGSGTVVRSWAA